MTKQRLKCGPVAYDFGCNILTKMASQSGGGTIPNKSTQCIHSFKYIYSVFRTFRKSMNQLRNQNE